jgi:hypothetical protein
MSRRAITVIFELGLWFLAMAMLLGRGSPQLIHAPVAIETTSAEKSLPAQFVERTRKWN